MWHMKLKRFFEVVALIAVYIALGILACRFEKKIFLYLITIISILYVVFCQIRNRKNRKSEEKKLS